MGTAGDDQSDVLLIDGTVFTDWTLTAKVGEQTFEHSQRVLVLGRIILARPMVLGI